MGRVAPESAIDRISDPLRAYDDHRVDPISDPEVRYIHAYPAVTNAASNAIAGKIGMENQGEFDNEGFAGIMRCNDWRIDLRLSQDHKRAKAVP